MSLNQVGLARWAAVLALVVASAGLSVAPGSSAADGRGSGAHDARAKRVVLIVVDQLRPEFVDAFKMRNIQRLMARGASFDNAYLGHMASETVVSHNVMTSGQLPKHMGWSDEWFRDSDGVLGAKDAMHVTGSMSQAQFDALIQLGDYPKLADYLHSAFPGKTVATVGEKNYAVNTMSGPASDIRMTFGGRSFDCDGDGVNNWRGPTGTNVPAYISGPACNRYYVDADKARDRGTATTSPAWMYPLEGDRDISGLDPAHPGGDVWVGDAALDIMDNEDWSGLMLTLGGVDKAGHMWGGLNDRPPYPGGDPSTHLASAARVADQQVGRVVDRLRSDGLLDETLVVLTTDHAQTTAKRHYGIDGAGRGNLNWYYGADSDESYLSPQPEIQRLIDETGNVQASMQDSAIRTWLVDRSPAALREAADVMATLGGVRATYYRKGSRYQLHWQARPQAFGPAGWAWHRKHAQELVNTMAAPYGPDVIGLLADGTSYGVKGDHGGAQESVQRIPIVFYGAGVQPGTAPPGAIRSVDIMPTILRELGIPETTPTDGIAYQVR